MDAYLFFGMEAVKSGANVSGTTTAMSYSLCDENYKLRWRMAHQWARESVQHFLLARAARLGAYSGGDILTMAARLNSYWAMQLRILGTSRVPAVGIAKLSRNTEWDSPQRRRGIATIDEGPLHRSLS